MPSTLSRARTTLVVLCFWAASPAAASDWKTINPAQLAMTQPRLDPNADAEAFLWEVRVADGANMSGELTTTFEQYVSIKIFTDRGREKYATVDIPYSSGTTVRGVAARTIRPDGSIVELKPSDIYERTILKANDVKVKVVSFAVPAIEPGVVVEYRWREIFRDSLATNLRLHFSRELPVHLVRYYVKPIQVPGFGMVAWPFNGNFAPPERQKDGASMITLTDVAADHDEAYGLPVLEGRPWVFISYETGKRLERAEFHQKFAKALHEESTERSRPDDAIRALAAASVSGASTETAKVAALVRAARENIRRIDVDAADTAARRTARANKNAAEALKRRSGTGDDVVLLFLALARSAGLDARVAASPNRAQIFERSVLPHPAFLNGRLVAVKTGDTWLFVEPSGEHTPAGELPWEYENQRVLVADPREVVFVKTPLSAPEQSLKKRTGTFRLLADGTLEGEARLEYTGHWATLFREQEDDQSAAEREKDLRNAISGRFPNAEISDVRIEHVTDTDGNYTNAYRLRIPGYAQRTGTRLFLQPSVFHKGVEAIFQTVERKSGIYFQFPWAEQDVVRIELPAGYTLDAPNAPTPLDVGAASLDTRIGLEGGATLVLRRNVQVGKGGAILFDVSAYRPLRTFFDEVHRADTHTLILRRKDGAQ